MNFQDAVKSALTENYANFNGRAARPEYWLFFLFYIVVYILGIVLDSITGFGLFTLIVTLGLLLPSLAVGARRLHDTGKSGWFQLLYIIPVLGFLIMIFFLVQQGDALENKYGAPPAK